MYVSYSTIIPCLIGTLPNNSFAQTTLQSTPIREQQQNRNRSFFRVCVALSFAVQLMAGESGLEPRTPSTPPPITSIQLRLSPFFLLKLPSLFTVSAFHSCSADGAELSPLRFRVKLAVRSSLKKGATNVTERLNDILRVPWVPRLINK